MKIQKLGSRLTKRSPSSWPLHGRFETVCRRYSGWWWWWVTPSNRDWAAPVVACVATTVPLLPRRSSATTTLAPADEHACWRLWSWPVAPRTTWSRLGAERLFMRGCAADADKLPERSRRRKVNNMEANWIVFSRPIYKVFSGVN